MVGKEVSFALYRLFFLISYISTIYVSLYYHWGCLSVLLTLPICMDLNKLCSEGKLAGLDQETAKFHMLFGMLTILGVYFTKIGVIEYLQ